MTKFGLYAFITVGLALSSCNNRHNGEEKPSLLSNVVSISENEDKGIKDILGFYGGYCKYSIGYSASIKEGKRKYFEIEMSKSDVLEKYAEILGMSASNIAYLFYRNLKQEKNSYDEIRVVILLKNDQEMTFNYSKEDLAIVEGKMGVVEKVVATIKSKKYEDLKTLLHPDTAYVVYNVDTLISNLRTLDPQIGNINNFVPHGFRFNEIESGQRKILHISGVLERDTQNINFSVDIDPKSTKDEVIVLQYKL